jgi:hypothetical protein
LIARFRTYANEIFLNGCDKVARYLVEVLELRGQLFTDASHSSETFDKLSTSVSINDVQLCGLRVGHWYEHRECSGFCTNLFVYDGRLVANCGAGLPDASQYLSSDLLRLTVIFQTVASLHE